MPESRRPDRPSRSGPKREGGSARGLHAAGREQPASPDVIPLPKAACEVYKRLSARAEWEHPSFPLARFIHWPEGWISAPAVKDEGYKRAMTVLNAEVRKRCAQSMITRRNAWLAAMEVVGLARRLLLTARTPCILHLANPSPLELGMALHHVYGFPVLPATSLKGLLHAEHPDSHRLYGEPERAAAITILDGIPKEYNVVRDIMTPHAPKWYQGEADAPDDTENPRPVPFLSIEAGAKFEIALIARYPETAAKDLDAVQAHLVDSLDRRGVGAKTAAGYGVMKVETLPAPVPSSVVGSPQEGSTAALSPPIADSGFAEMLSRIGALPPSPAGEIGPFLEWCLGLTDQAEKRKAAAAICSKMGIAWVKDKAKTKAKWQQILEIAQGRAG